jgi:AraC-like DNA-binding protein
LRESDRTIADIAFASGFNNLSNFNRQFRRTYGLPPTDYRRSAAGG